jgi:signal transduction histidine kinase
MGAALRRLPVAAQVTLLVVLAALLPGAALFGVAFAYPPPRQAPARIENVAAVLNGDALASGDATVDVQRAEPVPLRHMHRAPELEISLARITGLSQDRYRAWREHGPPPPRFGNIFGRYRAALLLPDGQWRVLTNASDPALDRWRWLVGSTVAVVMTVILVAGLLFARSMVAPIRRMGRAAAQARAGEQWTMPLPEGPPEVREAVASLMDLDQRTRDWHAQRLTMLAAISHDIGTPIARLAFRLEALPAEMRGAAMADVETIRRLLADSLTLAREWNGREERVDMAGLLAEIAGSEQAMGRDITWRIAGRPVVRGHRLSLQRMVQNLVDNALRYGETAEVTLSVERNQAVLRVADNGPGFPPMPAEELLKPYVRGDESRNPASGGSGLGLAIVDQVIRRHGGTIALINATDGGALVFVQLPAL